jgi:hypothetical protein
MVIAYCQSGRGRVGQHRQLAYILPKGLIPQPIRFIALCLQSLALGFEFDYLYFELLD